MEDLALHLTKSGHIVTVVTGFPSYPAGVVADGFHKRWLAISRWKDLFGLHRVWLYTSPKRDSFVRRMLHYLSFTITSIYGAMAAPRPDVVYVLSHPYFVALSGCLIKLITGAHLVMDIQDFWPEAPIALGLVKNRFLIRFLLWLERFLYNRCSLIIVLSDEMKGKVASRGIPENKIKHVFNWADLNLRVNGTNELLRKKLGLSGEFVLLFSGNIGVAQGLITFIAAAELLKDEPRVRFVFLGDGVEKGHIMNEARQRRLDNVLFLNSVQTDEVPKYYSMADVLILHLDPLPHRWAAVPSKLQGYMAAGKAVLAAAEGATAKLVEMASCGWAVVPANPKAIAERVRSALNMPREEIRMLGANGRYFAEENFEKNKQCSQIERELSLLV